MGTFSDCASVFSMCISNIKINIQFPLSVFVLSETVSRSISTNLINYYSAYHCLCTSVFVAVLMFEREREMFYLTTHSTHFIYGYMA